MSTENTEPCPGCEQDICKPRDPVYEDYMRRIGAHIPRRRSKRGQRRAAAKRWWIK